MGPEDRFAALVEEFTARPDVAPPRGGRGFGSSALTVQGSIFAMLVAGRLAVKLPRERVTELVTGGDGEPFRDGRGRAMREWVTVAEHADWSAVAGEALRFVGGR